MTKTQERVEFLRSCLKNGMSRPEAARELSKKDKRVSHGYAVTLVYQVFSGSDYAVRKPASKVTPAKKKTTAKAKAPAKPKAKAPEKKAPAKKTATKTTKSSKAGTEKKTVNQQRPAPPKRSRGLVTRHGIPVDDDDHAEPKLF